MRRAVAGTPALPASSVSNPDWAHGSAPGSHAEVYALNEALLAREKPTGKPVAQADLRSVTLDTVW